MFTVENTTARYRVFYLNEIRSISISPGLNILSDNDYELLKKLSTVQAAYDCGELKDGKLNEEQIEKSPDGLDVIRNSDGELVPVQGYSEPQIVTNTDLEKAAEEHLNGLASDDGVQKINTSKENEFTKPVSQTVKAISDDDLAPTIRITGEIIKDMQSAGIKVAEVTRITKAQPSQGYTKKELEEKLGDIKIDLNKYFTEN